MLVRASLPTCNKLGHVMRLRSHPSSSKHLSRHLLGVSKQLQGSGKKILENAAYALIAPCRRRAPLRPRARAPR